jgi:subtilisin family serine protease
MGKRKRFFTRTLAVRLASIALLIGIAFGGTGYGVSADSNGPPAPPPDRLLVKFKAGVSAERQAIHRQNGGKVIETIPSLGVEVVEVASGRGSEAARAYAQDARLRYAEIDYRAAKVGSVNDGYFSWQWAMTKIQAPEAWSLTTGSASIPIAILDTGVDASHADMAGKVIANLNLTTSPTAGDIDGHGTHVPPTMALGWRAWAITPASSMSRCWTTPVRVITPGSPTALLKRRTRAPKSST